MKMSLLQSFGALFCCLLVSNVAHEKSKIFCLTSQKITYFFLFYKIFQELLFSLGTLKFHKGVPQCGYKLVLGNLNRKIWFILSSL